MKSKINYATIRIFSFMLAFVLAFGSVAILIAEGCSSVALANARDATSQDDEIVSNDLTSGLDEVYLPNYDTEVITKTNLKKPKVETFGDHDASYYPSYTNQLSGADFSDEKKTDILNENIQILADAQNWFAEGTLKDNLKKHVSADGQFFNAAGNYDKAKRIEKIVTVNSKHTARRRSLGVFVPAGEIITVTIDESLVKSGLTVYIGYPYSSNDIGAGNIGRWSGDRMARFTMTFELKETVTYIGSPLGGMLSLNLVSSNLGNFDIKVSGGVDMPDYKLGVSTKDDWHNILAAPAPYVWLLTPHQYFVMPKAYINDVEDPYLALLWWHKASMISTYGIAREDTGHFYTPVISTFDSYVFVGEAVATVWAFYTNCPNSWCKSVLDYDNLMYGGAWGALHEYNHHHQAHSYATQWGVGYVDEMTNNVLNTACYIYLTDIALTRSADKMLGGWAVVSDPYSNYNRLASTSANKDTYEAFDTNKLFGFVDMMHTFGAGKFLDFIRAQFGYGEVEGYEGKNLTQDTSLQNADNFALFASLFYKTDFVDYFTKVWHMPLANDTVNRIKSYGFDEYFSINNLYSAGVKGIETGRAYQVGAEETTVLDFAKYTNCSVDTFTLESVSQPQHGTLVKNGDGTYSYTPDKGFTEDSFDLDYKVTLNGKTYSRTLVVKLVAQSVVEAERAEGTKTHAAFVDFRNQYMSNWYSNVVKSTPSEVACVDNEGNPVKTVNGADVNAMFDGQTSTGFHTAWQGTMTPYPHNYYFTFEEAALFNRINFRFQDNGSKGYYAIGEYEIYTSGDGVNYELLTAGNNTETNFNVVFDTAVTAKHVKLVVKSNASGKQFTNITEIEFAQSVNVGNNYNVYSSKNGVFNYSRRWRGISGNYLNSQAQYTKSGKVKFYVTGTDLMLYSTNANSKIRIDGVTYAIGANDKNYSPSFVIDGLSEGRHLIEIDAKDMRLDMIKTSGIVSRAKGPFVNWGGMGVSIAVGVALIAAITAVIVLEYLSKKKSAENTSTPNKSSKSSKSST
ncbi:MAG: M60 family metallopeptidase [Clostridiales bacterium]|nr:M60 family metallopeptidase [Clostridiales bacterium]